MRQIRERINRIIEHSVNGGPLGKAYDILMLVAIIASIIPLMFATEYTVFRWIEIVTVSIFIVDYLLRWFTADIRMGKGIWSFVLYPFSGNHRSFVHPARLERSIPRFQDFPGHTSSKGLAPFQVHPVFLQDTDSGKSYPQGERCASDGA